VRSAPVTGFRHTWECSLCIDGYPSCDALQASFLHLRHYPVGTLKLDAAFTAELGLDSTTDTIVASMVTLAHDLGMTVVAAGVETAEQHRRVRALGCDACQGYRLSRPVPAAAVGQLLDRRAVAVPVIPAQMTAADLRPPPFLHRPPSAGDQLQQ
jgi:predicted signal transduction protein with EAL and GGDEF domain